MPARRSQDYARGVPSLAPELPFMWREELRTLVTVSRTDKSDAGERQIIVRLDDAPRKTLLFGHSFTTEIAPGIHRLRAHNSLFWKTIDFAVEAGEHLEFIVINRAGPAALAFLAAIGAAPLFLTVKRRSLL
jgi:hypothetical protein